MFGDCLGFWKIEWGYFSNPCRRSKWLAQKNQRTLQTSSISWVTWREGKPLTVAWLKLEENPWDPKWWNILWRWIAWKSEHWEEHLQRPNIYITAEAWSHEVIVWMSKARALKPWGAPSNVCRYLWVQWGGLVIWFCQVFQWGQSDLQQVSFDQDHKLCSNLIAVDWGHGDCKGKHSLICVPKLTDDSENLHWPLMSPLHCASGPLGEHGWLYGESRLGKSMRDAFVLSLSGSLGMQEQSADLRKEAVSKFRPFDFQCLVSKCVIYTDYHGL